MRRPTTDGDDVCPREQLVKGVDRFEIAEEIQCIQSEFQVGWCPAQGEIERRQRRGEALEVVGCAAIAEVDVELHAVIGQQSAETLKRALFGRFVQSSELGARLAGRARRAGRARWA